MHIRVVKSVEHGPEDIALGAEGVVGGVLFFAAAGVFDYPGQSEVGVFGRLGEASAEIVEAGREPRVELAELFNAESDEAFGEKFGEGGSYGFDVGACGNEIDVSVDGVARSRENAFAAHGIDAGEAGGFDEFEPLFDTARAGVWAIAVVIDQTLAPCGAEGVVVAAGKKRGVFARDVGLVVVAVERPSLKLAAAEGAFMHQSVKGVFVVVALFADGVEAGGEFFFRE